MIYKQCLKENIMLNNNPVVGFMRGSRKPVKIARLLAKTSKYNGIDLAYFHALDVDVEQKVIHAKFLEENRWVERVIDVPPFIDILPYSFKHKKVVRFLKENSVLSSDRLGTKDDVYEKLLDDGEFSHLIIPTRNCSNFDELHNFLTEHRHIVIKPREGLRGHDVYSLMINNSGYKLSYQQTESILSLEELKKFYTDTLSFDKYIVQKYVSSITKNGEPFDCRIRLEKNGKGKWQVAIYLIRIGTNQKVVSNVAQGGSVSRLEPFLEANFPMISDELKTSIQSIAKTLPSKTETLFQTNLTSLGIDIGIDKNGDLFLFEIEPGPGSEFALGEIALIKSEYYKYIMNKLSN